MVASADREFATHEKADPEPIHLVASRGVAMINVVVVGHGMASRYFHCPLIRRQPKLRLYGLVVLDPEVRAEAVEEWGPRGARELGEALADPATDLIVIATPHHTHPELTIRSLEAGKGCVVDK